jgi:hypothetical protein
MPVWAAYFAMIKFERSALEFDPGQLLTIPGGVRHRTRPVGARSVNLTFELAQSDPLEPDTGNDHILIEEIASPPDHGM